MKRIGLLIMTLSCMLLFGCEESIDCSLPDDAIAFEDTIIEDQSSITYNDRMYVMYGSLNGNITGADVKRCVGYIVNPNVPDDTSKLVFTLVDDVQGNYLMCFSTDGVTEPVFYRSEGSRGLEVETPAFVQPKGIGYWNVSSGSMPPQ